MQDKFVLYSVEICDKLEVAYQAEQDQVDVGDGRHVDMTSADLMQQVVTDSPWRRRTVRRGDSLQGAPARGGRSNEARGERQKQAQPASWAARGAEILEELETWLDKLHALHTVKTGAEIGEQWLTEHGHANLAGACGHVAHTELPGALGSCVAWLATLKGSALLVGIPAVGKALKEFSLLPEKQQTAAGLVAIVVPVILEEAAWCVGHHCASQWALSYVATHSCPAVIKSCLVCYAHTSKAMIGGAIINAPQVPAVKAGAAAKVGAGKAAVVKTGVAAKAGAGKAAVVKTGMAAKAGVAAKAGATGKVIVGAKVGASAFVAANALPLAIGGAIVLSLGALCLWGWRKRRRK